MRKNILYLVGLIIILTSCNKEINRKDINLFVVDIINVFEENDSVLLQTVYQTNLDSVVGYQKEHIENIFNFFEGAKVKYLKFDAISEYFSDDFSALDMYFLKENSYYKIRAKYSHDSIQNIIVENLYFNNLKELCKEDMDKPFCPSYSIDFKSISWTTDYYQKTFKSGEVILQNNSDYDLEYIKFRIVLKKGTSYYDSEVFFNQTVVSHKKIFKGDINTINIEGLEGFYTGFKIDKDNLLFDADLIEVLPKPESSWCKEIKDLNEKFEHRQEE